MALGDPEGNVLASIDAVCKRFINPTKRKFMSFRIDCLDVETKNFIESKLKNLDSQNIDQNIFDGAVNLVMNHLSTKFYPNFLTSDIFVNYVRVSWMLDCVCFPIWIESFKQNLSKQNREKKLESK